MKNLKKFKIFEEDSNYGGLKLKLDEYFKQLQAKGMVENLRKSISTKFEFDCDNEHYEVGIDLGEEGENRIYIYSEVKGDDETVNSFEDIDNFINDTWTDPAGGTHRGDDEDPAAMYENESKEIDESETSTYKVPNNVVKVPDGDTGFALVKKHYRRFIWTWNQYAGKKPNITND